MKDKKTKKDIDLASVNFYELDQDDEQGKMQTACRLAAQAYKQAMSVFILTPNESTSKAIDDLLWNFPPHRFIPHSLQDGDESSGNLIRIDHKDPEQKSHLLINLTQRKIGIAGKVERIFEIVLPHERTSARDRQHHYEQLNCTIQIHSVKLSARR